MKLRKVVEELVAAAEEHHRKHHHHRHHHHSKKDKKDKKSKKAGAEAGAEDAAAGATAGSPWCENSVREVLERKVRSCGEPRDRQAGGCVVAHAKAPCAMERGRRGEEAFGRFTRFDGMLV